MPATLGDAGLSVQTQAEILAEIRADLQDPVTGLGPLHDVTSATSPVAILAGVAARREAQFQSLLAALTSALFPGGAAGAQLDRQATITGDLDRIEESNSTVLARLSGTPGTDVSNKLVRYKPNQSLWTTSGDLFIGGSGNVITTLRADDSGPIDADASDQWEIVSTTSGWNFLLSIEDAQLGELEEDDPTFRDRLAHTDSVGRGTEPAIYARLLEIPGVTSIAVDNNRGLVPNINGVPGKSVESLVIGGEDAVIAEVLHETYECDSGSFGNTTVEFTNRFGKDITIQFSRVDDVQCFAKVTIITSGGETPLPADFVNITRAAMGARAAQLAPGQDLQSAWFVGPAVAALPQGSVVTLNVEFAYSELGVYSLALPLTSRQRGVLSNGPVPAIAKSLQKPGGFNIDPGWHLDLRIDGAATVPTIFVGGVGLTGQDVAAEVEAAFVNSGTPATATGALNRLRVATDGADATHTIQVMNTSTAALLAILGGDFAVPATFTGSDQAIVTVIAL